MFKVSPEIGSKYRFVSLCAQRTRQLLEGADHRVESEVSKPAYIAMQEVLADKVPWKKADAPQPDGQEKVESIELETST